MRQRFQRFGRVARVTVFRCNCRAVRWRVFAAAVETARSVAQRPLHRAPHRPYSAGAAISGVPGIEWRVVSENVAGKVSFITDRAFGTG